jgi:ABC transporter substrate binding protein
MPVVGYLASGSVSLPIDVRAFWQGLSEAGLVDGHNVTIEFRFARDQNQRLPSLATELVQKQVAVIFTTGGVAPARAAKDATSTIPTVFAHGSDPVRTGLVASLNRPGGNVTGVTFVTGILQAKSLELLHEVVPRAGIIGVLVNPMHCNRRTPAQRGRSSCARPRYPAQRRKRGPAARDRRRHHKVSSRSGLLRFLWSPIPCFVLTTRILLRSRAVTHFL